MTIFDDIRKDREAGTLGPWGISGATNVRVMAGGLHVATIPRAADGDWSHSNARRIARVPRLEWIALAAEELAKASDAQLQYMDMCNDKGDLERNLRAALAAFRAACGEGE